MSPQIKNDAGRICSLYTNWMSEIIGEAVSINDKFLDVGGNSMIAMAGKNCVAIASDTRLGVQLSTIDSNLQRVFKVNDLTIMGLAGLVTDV